MKHLRFLFATLLLASLPVHAECLLVAPASTPPTVVQVAGQPTTLPALLKVCREVQVISGRAVACSQDRRGRRACRSLAPGERYSAEAAPPGEYQHDWGRALRDMLGGAEAPVAAMSRGGPQEDLLPHGRISLLTGHLLIDFADPGLAGAQRWEVHQGSLAGPVVLSVTATGQPARVEARALRAGTTYWWRLHTQARDEPAVGSFSVATPAQRASVLAERQRIQRRSPADPAAQALLLADWLLQQGQRFDAAQALRAEGLVTP